jgi:rSAM/selenodomain-associated transferase 2
MVSIIIPALNEEESLPFLLENLASQEGDFEIIVADGGSVDNTLTICKSYPDIKIISCEKGRALQMNKGAEIARGNTLLFLHADTLLPRKGIITIENVMNDDRFSAGSFLVRFDHEDWILSFLARFTRINNRYLTWGDHGIFIRRSIFNEIGGYKNIPLMEDLEIQKRVRRRGKFIKLPLPVTTSSRRFIQNGILRQKLLNIALIMAYEIGVAPARIKKFYSDHT